MQFVNNEKLDNVTSGDGFMVGVAQRNAGSLLLTGELCGSFDGVNSYLRYIQEHQPVPMKGLSSSHRGTKDGFYTFDGYAEALKTYLHTPAKVRQFTELDTTLKGGESDGLDVVFDITGDYIDMGRYLEGEPECFGSMTNGNPRGLRVNMIVDMNWVHYVTAEQCNLRGQRIQRLVDWLETQRVRVQVLAVRSGECSHVEIMVKDHDDILDINDLAVMSHSDFLRRIGFRFDEYSDTWQSGYGSASLLSSHLLYNGPYPELQNEITILVRNNASQIDSEFDQLEKSLAKVLSDLPEDPAARRFVVL